jgi:hypothetical protein
MRTAFTELVGVQHPIVGFNPSPGVVAAVTNAGGLGLRAQIPPEHLAFVEELRAVRRAGARTATGRCWTCSRRRSSPSGSAST